MKEWVDERAGTRPDPFIRCVKKKLGPIAVIVGAMSMQIVLYKRSSPAVAEITETMCVSEVGGSWKLAEDDVGSNVPVPID